MATLTAEAAVAGSETKPPAKTKERTRRRRGSRVDGSGARYFLVKSSASDKMELAEEAASAAHAEKCWPGFQSKPWPEFQQTLATD